MNTEMTETTKSRVLAKCGELCPDLDIHVFGDDRIEQRANGYSMWDGTMSIMLYVSEDLPEDARNWKWAAEILGIEDDQAAKDRELLAGATLGAFSARHSPEIVDAYRRLLGLEVQNG